MKPRRPDRLKQRRRIEAAPDTRASESGAATAEAAAPAVTSLAALLTRHILRDGELVLLILKPSLWYIVFTSMRFTAIVLILLIAARLGTGWRMHNLIQFGVFLVAGRVMWAILQWMGRLYVLTDMRIVRLAGVFNVEIFDCPLRKVATARLLYSFRERLLFLGSIEIICEETGHGCIWQTIKRPVEVHQKILTTIQRAKQGSALCPN